MLEGAEKMTITTEEAELLARISDINGPTRRGAIIRSLAAERDALRAENARLQEALNDKETALLRVAQWTGAYPEDIFPPVHLEAAREKLGDDALFSRLHAEWARHLCKGIGEIVRAALGETQ